MAVVQQQLLAAYRTRPREEVRALVLRVAERQWAASALPPEALPVVASVHGWRVWMMTGDGHLANPGTGVGSLTVWRPGGVQAWCLGHVLAAELGAGTDHDAGHRAPAPGCECGVYLLTTLADLLDALRSPKGRHKLDIVPAAWLLKGPGYAEDRARWDVLDVPDVIGVCEAWGERHPAPDDPPTTIRAQYARVVDRVHLSPHLPREAKRLARTQNVHVVVGAHLGTAWLDDIAEYEATLDKQPPRVRGEVTRLAPAGSVLPRPSARTNGMLRLLTCRLMPGVGD